MAGSKSISRSTPGKPSQEREGARGSQRSDKMMEHAIATREEWLEARRDLLAAEKDLTRRSDQVAQLRRQLPWVRVEKKYTFDGPEGRRSLADLFDGRRQLMFQHFMLTPGAEQGCPSCSYMADHTDGMTMHLAHRDVTFVAISRAPLAEIERFRHHFPRHVRRSNRCERHRPLRPSRTR